MSTEISIAGRKIGTGHPAYVIAELSANHNQSIERARELIQLAADAGADAVKIQTYTPDTMTIDCDNPHFTIGKGTIWEGRTLYDLYGEAATPWEWTADLIATAKACGLTLFSTPFDDSSVDFLETMGMPAYKIASFELVDLPLLKRVAATGKPVILSTGMGTEAEIKEAVSTLKDAGCVELAVLKCTSAYPAPAEDANLALIPAMAEKLSLPVGLSDHTLGHTVAVTATALGACIIEKHFTRSRSEKGPDSEFSMQPEEFKAMVERIRTAEKSIGVAEYRLSPKEQASRVFRRSIFITADIEAGGLLTPDNCRVIRPGYGMAPRELPNVLGKKVVAAVKRGTPLQWNLIEDEPTKGSEADPG
ncbi:MAG: pseudaminic acid synthase [Puniceicoccaceae bacterium]